MDKYWKQSLKYLDLPDIFCQSGQAKWLAWL